MPIKVDALFDDGKINPTAMIAEAEKEISNRKAALEKEGREAKITNLLFGNSDRGNWYVFLDLETGESQDFYPKDETEAREMVKELIQKHQIDHSIVHSIIDGREVDYMD